MSKIWYDDFFTLDVLFTLFFLFRCINNCIPDECLNMKLRVVY